MSIIAKICTLLVLLSGFCIISAQRHPERSLSCDRFPHEGLPCVEVPRCSESSLIEKTKSSSYVTVTVDQLSTGLGAASSTMTVDLCFDDINLYATYTAFNQTYFPAEKYTECNDPVFYQDVIEIFVVPYMEKVAHCYNELDISPYNVMFEAGIYNKNLNYTGVVDSTMNCSTSGVIHETTIDETSNSWTAQLTYPFHLLNCPYNCPMWKYCGHDTPNDIYRANFFRVNELKEVSSCSSSTCEYIAWNPTDINPPAFHEPSKFGFLLLQFD